MTNILGSTDALMNITARPPVIFTQGKGSWLWDSSGKRYLDFVQGWAVNCLGHSPDTVADAISLQSRELLTPSPAYYNGRSVEFASALAASSCFDEVFFTNSGAEAVEGAIKLARKYGSLHRGGAFEIITFDGAFHGRTLAAMSASGKKIFEPLFNPKVPGFPKATLNDIGSVEALIGDNTVAVMLEPIQGESGVWPGTDAFLRDLRKLTQEKGLLLIVDEVQTGFGRTGALFHYQHAGITPDVMVLGKGIGGGVPLGALLARGSACCFEHGDQGGTFNGGALVCAVGLAVLKEVNAPDFLQMVADNGEFLADELRDLSLKHGLGEVRGRGLLVALSLGRPVGPSIVAAAFEAGLLLNAPRADCLRFMPALNVTRDEIIEMIERVDQLIGSVAE